MSKDITHINVVLDNFSYTAILSKVLTLVWSETQLKKDSLQHLRKAIKERGNTTIR